MRAIEKIQQLLFSFLKRIMSVLKTKEEPQKLGHSYKNKLIFIGRVEMQKCSSERKRRRKINKLK